MLLIRISILRSSLIIPRRRKWKLILGKHNDLPIKISLKFVPKGPINNIPALVQIMAWRRTGDKPLSEPMMTRRIYMYASLGLNELKGPCDQMLTHWGRGISNAAELCQHWLKWWHVAWRAPSHYLNQCWLIVNWIPGNKPRSTFNEKNIYFLWRQCFWKCRLQNGDQFFSASMC